MIEAWRKPELQAAEFRLSNLGPVFRQGKRFLDGGRNLFEDFCAELCSKLDPDNKSYMVTVVSLTFPQQRTSPRTEEEWREQKDFELLLAEFQPLNGVSCLFSIESHRLRWKEGTMSFVQPFQTVLRVFNDLRELCRYVSYSPNSLDRNPEGNWHFFSLGDKSDELVSQISPIRMQDEAYQFQAALQLLRLLFRRGQQNENSRRLENALRYQ